MIDLDSKPKRKEFVKVPRKKKPAVSKLEAKGTAKDAIEPDRDAVDAELVLDQEPVGALVTADGAILPEIVFDEDGQFRRDVASEFEDPAKDLVVDFFLFSLLKMIGFYRYFVEFLKFFLFSL